MSTTYWKPDSNVSLSVSSNSTLLKSFTGDVNSSQNPLDFKLEKSMDLNVSWWDAHASSSPRHTINSLSMNLVWCKPGVFIQGSPTGGPSGNNNEIQHEVTLSKGFYISEFEVTQAQWKSLMDSESLTDENIPKTNIHWGEAKKFCETLTQNEKDAGTIPDNWAFELPTEAQWEYAVELGLILLTFGGTISTPLKLILSTVELESQLKSDHILRIHGVYTTCTEMFGN